MTAADKTTFAERLAAAVRNTGRPVQVVHLDDFLNPRAIRYARGRASPLGYFLDTYDLAAFHVRGVSTLAGGRHPAHRSAGVRPRC